MSGRSRVAAAVTWLTALLTAAATCGGQIALGVEGTLDDAGEFHLPDGAILFAPGSACVGYDAGGWTTPPCTTQCVLDEAGTNAQCLAWAASLGPAELTTFGVCRQNGEDDAGIPICECGAFGGLGPPCDYENYDAGNAFCSAWAQQFVTGGTAVARCHKACTVRGADGGVEYYGQQDPCWAGLPGAAFRGSCTTGGVVDPAPDPCSLVPQSSGDGCENMGNLPLCVTRSGVSKCEAPCQGP
jgi:hypothetical protein